MRSRKLDTNADNSLRVLHMLSREGTLTAGQIAEGLGITPASVTQILKKLEMQGTAQRVKSKDDSRVTFVRLTPQGEKVVEHRRQTVDDVQDQLFAGFDHQDLSVLERYLEQMINNVTDKRFRQNVREILGDDANWSEFDALLTKFATAKHILDQPDEDGQQNDDSFSSAHDQWVKKWKSDEQFHMQENSDK